MFFPANTFGMSMADQMQSEIAMQASTSAATMDEQSTAVDEAEAYFKVGPGSHSRYISFLN